MKVDQVEIDRSQVEDGAQTSLGWKPKDEVNARRREGMQTLEMYRNRRMHQSFEKLPRMSEGWIRGSLRVFVLATKGSRESRRIRG